MADQQLGSSRFDKSRVDWLLRSLVGHANSGAELPITLTVGGILVSGTLAPGREYLESLGEQFGNDEGDKFKKMADDLYGEFENSEDPDLESISYIHVKNVRFYGTQGKSIPRDNQGIWWRGHLESIDGFTIGSLGHAD